MGVSLVWSERWNIRTYAASQKKTPRPRQTVEAGMSQSGADGGGISDEPMILMFSNFLNLGYA